MEKGKKNMKSGNYAGKGNRVLVWVVLVVYLTFGIGVILAIWSVIYIVLEVCRGFR